MAVHNSALTQAGIRDYLLWVKRVRILLRLPRNYRFLCWWAVTCGKISFLEGGPCRELSLCLTGSDKDAGHWGENGGREDTGNYDLRGVSGRREERTPEIRAEVCVWSSPGTG